MVSPQSEWTNCEIQRGCAQTASRLLGAQVFVDTPNQTVSDDNFLSLENYEIGCVFLCLCINACVCFMHKVWVWTCVHMCLCGVHTHTNLQFMTWYTIKLPCNLNWTYCNILKESPHIKSNNFSYLWGENVSLLLALPTSSGSTKFAWQFLRLVLDLFFCSRTTFSWSKDTVLKEANGAEVKYGATIGPLWCWYE